MIFEFSTDVSMNGSFVEYIRFQQNFIIEQKIICFFGAIIIFLWNQKFHGEKLDYLQKKGKYYSSVLFQM